MGSDGSDQVSIWNIRVQIQYSNLFVYSYLLIIPLQKSISNSWQYDFSYEINYLFIMSINGLGYYWGQDLIIFLLCILALNP